MSTSGLRLEQAPPLSVPISFFLTAPLALMTAGALLAHGGASVVATRFAGPTAALVHLGTLGFFASVMLGALYQMIPVVAGAPVPAVRSAHVVHAALVAGLAALVWGFHASERPALVHGAGVVAGALTLFLLTAAVALVRAPARTMTVTGMRLAALGFAAAITLGLLLSLARGSGRPSPHYTAWFAAHVSIGLLVWIGGLITSVSFQVVPMFYLTPPLPRWGERTLIGAISASLIGLVFGALFGLDPRLISLGAAPAALAVYVLHPVLVLRAIARRRRRRADPSLVFWRAGLAVGSLVLPAGVAAAYASDARYPVLLGWLALFGWGGLIVHGMLTRIVPFMVWFHRFSQQVGQRPVTPMRQLWPDRSARVGLYLHLATLMLGVSAAITGSNTLGRATGIGLMLVGASIVTSIVRVLRAA